ncbi:MAG: Rrf2 family transcriptional regulator [Firmicutes bacterium]|nr:Rrf2 family transcriptional regulator [Bacillota bacterium]
MHFSSRTEYGVKAMLDLALHYGEGPVPLRAIAGRQSVSEHYLEQLMGALRKAGLVASARGAQGGYELAREPGSITVGDVVRALEGPIAPLPCVEEDGRAHCDEIARCVARTVWVRLRSSMEEVLDSTTFADLCQKALQQRNTGDSFMYYI